MTAPMQLRNRQEIRHAIGRNLGDVVIGEATSNGTSTTLVDAYNFVFFGDDAIIGRQLVIYDAAGSIVDGEKSFVTDYAASGTTATHVAFSTTTADGDKYELWKALMVEDVHEEINNAIIAATKACLQPKVSTTAYTGESEYEYNCLSGFVGVYQVETVFDTGIAYTLEACDSAWSELVDGDVTITADSVISKVGSSVKMVAASGLAAGDIMATQSITSKDISDCDTLEIWVYSTVALSAGDIQVLLDNTAACASALESLNIPATSANTWTRHSISLANPASDTAIISVGIKQVTDKGAFTLYVDDIRAVKATSRHYIPVPPEEWDIVKGSTPYLKLTSHGLATTGYPNQLRISGYEIPDLLSDDTTDSEVDPAFIIAYATGQLLIAHAKSPRLDIEDRQTKAKYWLGKAEALLLEISAQYEPTTKWVSY